MLGARWQRMLRTPACSARARHAQGIASRLVAADAKAASEVVHPVQAEEALTLVAPSERGMRHLADALAADRRPGDVYLLHGAVGAGKSTFR